VPKVLRTFIDRPLRLATPGGELVIAEHHFEIETDADRITAARITFDVDEPMYQRMIEHGWFDLTSDPPTKTLLPVLDPARPVRIEAELDAQRLEELEEIASGNVYTAAAWVVLSGEQYPEHPVVSMKSWHALHVTQERDGVEQGYSTERARAALPMS
jgi:hypothetical protein